MFDLTLMQDATENFHYPEVVAEPLRVELNFIFPLEHVTGLIVLGKRKSLVAVETFGVVGEKNSKMDNASLQQKVERIPLLKNRYRGLFPSDYVAFVENDTFTFINTQPSKL